MSAVDLDTDTIAELDFSPVIPCTHRQHRDRHAGDEPAAWVLISLCMHCQRVAPISLCEPGRRFMATAGIVSCTLCKGTNDWAAFVIWIHPIEGAS